MNFIIFIVCFPEPDQLNSARMPKNNQLPCPKCDGKFSGQFGLKIHMRKKHSDDSISKSPKSLKSKRMSRSRTSMNFVVPTVVEPKNKFDCDQCDRTFTNENYLNRHINVTHNTSQFKCDKCHKIFGNKRSLKGHENECKKEESVKPTKTTAVQIWNGAKCDRCDRSFASARGVMIHKRSCKEVTFDCSQCDTKLKNQETLDLHVKFCHEIPEEMSREMEIVMFQCDMCEAKFPEKHILLLHMKMSHDTIAKNKIPCDRCDLKFSKAESLVSHYKLIHLDEKLTCDRCHKEFGMLHNLIRHKSFFECGTLAIKMESEMEI